MCHHRRKWHMVGFSLVSSIRIYSCCKRCLEGEYFDDNDGARIGVMGLQMSEVTLTTNIKDQENILVRPESVMMTQTKKYLPDKITNLQQQLVLPICSNIR